MRRVFMGRSPPPEKIMCHLFTVTVRDYDSSTVQQVQLVAYNDVNLRNKATRTLKRLVESGHVGSVILRTYEPGKVIISKRYILSDGSLSRWSFISTNKE